MSSTVQRDEINGQNWKMEKFVDYFIEREIHVGVKDKKYFQKNQIYYIINFCLFGIHNKKKWFFLYVHVLDEREDV